MYIYDTKYDRLLTEAPFDVNAMKSALFPNGTADQNASYVCSQSIFQCDVLFNADPSVYNSDLN